jgi:hypothetical protein
MNARTIADLIGTGRKKNKLGDNRSDKDCDDDGDDDDDEV